MPDRQLLTLSEADWSWLGEIAERGALGQVLIEFWRKALGYTMEEWTALAPGSFNVMDYHVSEADHDRLYELAKIKSDGKADVMALAMLWLDVGPAVIE